jgi:hypothetical protein
MQLLKLHVVFRAVRVFEEELHKLDSNLPIRLGRTYRKP